MTLTQGQTIQGRYRVAGLLGQGGFGAVYKGWDVNLNRPVAIKENLDMTPEAQRQFQHEAQMLSDISHANLPRVTDHFVIPNLGQYLVMDFVEGEDLQAMLNRTGHALPEAQALAWIDQICDALTYLHTQEPPIIHRDIKPANIKITPKGKAVLVDFGIAKIFDPVLKTTVGARAVTPGYSPPEQYGQGQTDQRSDVYSLGATLYTLLTGQEPPESVERVANNAILIPPRQVAPVISQATNDAILRACEISTTRRYQTMAELRQALKTSLPHPVPVRPAPAQRPTPAPRPTPSPQPTPLPQSYPRGGAVTKPPWGWIVVGLAVVAVLIFALRQITFAPVATPAPAQPAISTHTPPPPITRAPTVTPAAVVPASSKVSDQDGMTLLYVPAGEFTMGSNDGNGDEKSPHPVYLDAFYIDQTEVTNAMYAKCVAAGKCQAPPSPGSNTRSSYYGTAQFANYPVIHVSWNDATAYCQWAGGDLPTEAQWEKATLVVTPRPYPWGPETPDASRLNFNQNVVDTTEVGKYPTGASFYGALDMAGNVWEWVADWYDSYPSSPARNPTGPSSGTYRVLRGGGWNIEAAFVRASGRIWNFPDNRGVFGGFRCAR